MKSKIRHILFGAALLMAGCTDDEKVNGQWSMVNDQSPVGQPVLFSAGNLAEVRTRAGEALGSVSPYYHGMSNTSGVPYMALDGRFVCTMYYHAKATDTDADSLDIKDNSDGGTMTTAWLKVNNNVGNSVYWNKEYAAASNGLDEYGFDKNATMFYWQNRLTHAFLALADYNKLTTNVGTTTNTTEDKGKLKMYPNWDKDFAALPTLAEGETYTQAQQDAFDDKLSDGRYANAYDLTRGEIWEEQDVDDGNGGTVRKKVLTGYNVNTIYQQPDPILALTIMKPAGATQEANRVRLYFKHQFSQIQVNIKGADDNSTEITADQIEGVELLGVSTEGYVCNRLNVNGTVGAASAKDVVINDYSDAVLEDNKWGTSFQMFDMATEGHVEPAYDEYKTWTVGETKYVQEDGDSYILATNDTYYFKSNENDANNDENNFTLIADIGSYNFAYAYEKVEHITVSFRIFNGTIVSGTYYYYKEGDKYLVIENLGKIYVKVENNYQELEGDPAPDDNYDTYYYKNGENYREIYERIETTTYTFEPITFYKKIHHEAKPTTGYATGYLKSFDAIAFGKLSAIRITWHELTAKPWTEGETKYVHVSGDTYEEATGDYYQKVNDTYTKISNLDTYNGSSAYTRSGDSEPYTYTEVPFYKIVQGIKHVATFEVPQTNDDKVKLQELQSGMKYIYNLELRRGTLAVIRTEILPWGQDKNLVYGTDGTITN